MSGRIRVDLSKAAWGKRDSPKQKRIRRSIERSGYIAVWDGGTWRGQHRVVAERVLGRRLKRHEEVHHIDGNKRNNKNENLLICTRAYHRALHRRCYDRFRSWHLPPSKGK